MWVSLFLTKEIVHLFIEVIDVVSFFSVTSRYVSKVNLCYDFIITFKVLPIISQVINVTISRCSCRKTKCQLKIQLLMQLGLKYEFGQKLN